MYNTKLEIFVKLKTKEAIKIPVLCRKGTDAPVKRLPLAI